MRTFEIFKDSGTDGFKIISQSIMVDMSKISDDEYIKLCSEALIESIRLNILSLRK